MLVCVIRCLSVNVCECTVCAVCGVCCVRTRLSKRPIQGRKPKGGGVWCVVGVSSVCVWVGKATPFSQKAVPRIEAGTFRTLGENHIGRSSNQVRARFISLYVH